MDNSRIVFLINDTVCAIEAQYEENGTKEVFKTFDHTLAVDDLAVVQSGTRHGMTVVKVCKINVDVNFDSSAPIKWVVQKIDKPGFDRVLGQEAEAIAAVQAAELRRKKEELRQTMFKDHEASIARLSLASRADEPVTE
jgi:hypothetical protein